MLLRFFNDFHTHCWRWEFFFFHPNTIIMLLLASQHDKSDRIKKITGLWRASIKRANDVTYTHWVRHQFRCANKVRKFSAFSFNIFNVSIFSNLINSDIVVAVARCVTSFKDCPCDDLKWCNFHHHHACISCVVKLPLSGELNLNYNLLDDSHAFCTATTRFSLFSSFFSLQFTLCNKK